MITGSNSFDLHGYKVLTDSNEIIVDGDVIRLTPKEKDVLLILYNNRGRTVSRSQLLETAWGDAVGNDLGLTQAISRLRQIFKDDPKQPKVIKTIPKSGYQLLTDTHSKLIHEGKKPGIFSYYRNLSKLERSGIKVILVLILLLLILLLVTDIQIRVEEL